MPAKSASQRRLMAAAEHGASFPKARALRHTLSPTQLHDFATGPTAAHQDSMMSRHPRSPLKNLRSR